MKESIILILAFLCCLLLAAGCICSPPGQLPATSVSTQQKETPYYVIGVDADYPPFTYRDSSGYFTGIDIEAARWIAARKGFEVEFVAVPWNQILDALLERRIDMVYSGMTITPERLEKVAFTIPYFTVTKSVAVRSDSHYTMDDLSAGRLRVGAQAGSTAEDWVEMHLVHTGIMPAGQVSLFPDVPSLASALVNGSIDASVSDTPAQQEAIAGKPLVILGEIPSSDMYAIAVRKTDFHLLTMMDEGLRELMADPYWQELLKRYGLRPLSSVPFRKLP